MKETLPFLITWMDFEGIRSGEINHIKKYKYCITKLIHGILKAGIDRNTVEWWLLGMRGGGNGEMLIK